MIFVSHEDTKMLRSRQSRFSKGTRVLIRVAPSMASALPSSLIASAKPVRVVGSNADRIPCRRPSIGEVGQIVATNVSPVPEDKSNPLSMRA